ncbi:hypothetical protein 2 [Hubei diptera virus 22]|uniref:RNA-directed RNA polymerase n=1 Tax=Hubei diptera virus 22 TaxID=1922883 RepID=A0A1L3KF99_9VIRU|nr:hypothetical protein 2 [Hubei diptera virus 22]APG76027.1 hypothetical protein 2 [Hubei diptera virus 22]
MAYRGFTPTDAERLEQLTNGVYRARLDCGTVQDVISRFQLPRIEEKPFSWRKDADLVAIFQPSPGQYVSGRRLKMSSILKYYKTPLLPYLTGLTYQTALNVLVWSQALTPDELAVFLGHGMFADQLTFERTSSSISQYVKHFASETRGKRMLGEFHALGGFKHEDPDWDLDAEIASLAGANPSRVSCWPAAWAEAADAVMVAPPEMPTWISFEQYVKSLVWTTSGSSSVGLVHYFDGKRQRHFKPRKNMVTTLFTPDELWALVSAWDGTIRNIPVVKNELGKIRLAIASNFESYVWESYCLDMFGHGFKNWGGITLDETVAAESTRNEKDMARLGLGWYALPWDFASFDHQVRTEEIQDILTRMAAMADPRVRHQWARVIGSYSHAILTNPKTNKTYQIKHGLQSGQRTTSLIGNVWNAVATRAAIRHCCSILGRDPGFTVGIRGDDTYVMARNPADLYILRLSYAFFGLIGHDKKFSIRPHSLEFLRNTTTSKRVIGWPCRAVPAITERKPWSDDLLDPASEVVTIADNIRNFERRAACELPLVHQSNKFQWSKFTSQTYLWLSLPRRLGGYGIYPFKGFIPDGKLSLTPEIQPTIEQEFSRYSPAYLGLTPQQSQIYNRTRFLSMLRPSDMRNLLGSIMDDFKMRRSLASKAKVTWRKQQLPDVGVLTTKIPLPSGKHLVTPRVDLRSSTPDWPPLPQFLSDYPGYRRAHQDNAISLATIMREHYPVAWSWMRRYERWGWHRSDALDMVMGTPPSEPIWPLNSKVRSTCLNHLVGNWVRPPPGFMNRGKIGFYAYHVTRAAVEVFSSSAKSFQYLY